MNMTDETPAPSVGPPPGLSFVMPVTLREAGRTGSGESWRRSMDAAPLTRLVLALTSMQRHLDHDAVHSVMLLCPDDEVATLRETLAPLLGDSRYHVLPEGELLNGMPLPRDPESGRVRGWYLQQMLKLSAAFVIDTPFMVTLDSDVLCLRQCRARDLVAGGRAWTNVETLETYQTLYTPAFAQQEQRIKEQRMLGSQRLLGYRRRATYQGTYYGETPCVWHTESVRRLCRHLQRRFARPWQHVLAATQGWTEIALYYQFLEMTGELEHYHRLTHAAYVLDLPKSIWQPTTFYRKPRRYDQRHITEDLSQRQDGHFMVIQSWLPFETWLPATDHDTLQGLYQAVAGWLDLDLSEVSVSFHRKHSFNGE